MSSRVVFLVRFGACVGVGQVPERVRRLESPGPPFRSISRHGCLSVSSLQTNVLHEQGRDDGETAGEEREDEANRYGGTRCRHVQSRTRRRRAGAGNATRWYYAGSFFFPQGSQMYFLSLAASNHGPAAGHVQRDARDPGRALRCQKQCGQRHVLGRPHPP